MRVSLDKATQAQLLRFAQVRLGLKNIHPKTGADKLVAKIRELYSEDTIEVDAHAPDGGDAGPQAQRGGYVNPPATKRQLDPLKFGYMDPLVGIRIHPQNGKGGNRNVETHLNGVEYFIPRGQDVEIPYRYYKVLTEAVGDVHEGWDDKTNQNSPPRESQSYTYTVNHMPSRAEIESFNEKMEPFLAKQRAQKRSRIMASRRIREERDGIAA